MTVEVDREAQTLVTRGAASSIGVAVVSGLAARLVEGAVGSNLVVAAIVAVGMAGGLWIYQRAIVREAKRQVPKTLLEVAKSHELSFRPWTVALSGFFMILAAEFVAGFLFGFVLSLGFGWEGVISYLESIGATEADIMTVVQIGAVYTGIIAMMAVSALVGLYMSHRIKDNEIWWILGTVAAARLVSAVIGLALFGGPWVWWAVAALTAAMAVPALLGHARAQGTREQFTIGYLGALLGEGDRNALMDLVTELTPVKAAGEI